MVPLHLAAFVLLYFGILHILHEEILDTHTSGALMLLQETIRDVHPHMVADDGRSVGDRRDAFVGLNTPVDLRLFDQDGVRIGRTQPADPEVVEFLKSAHPDRFEVNRRGGQVLLQGIMQIESTEECGSCHQVGEVLGAASVNVDVTPETISTNRRLGVGLAVILVGWTALVGILNVAVTTTARRKFAGLQQDLSPGGEALVGGTSDSTGLMLDPVSAELYVSLRDVLRKQKDRERDIAARMQHAQRLALLGRDAAGLAHEIKNPLAGIQGALELLQDQAASDTQRAVFRQMLEELDRVNQTLQSLLQYAKPIQPDRTPTDISNLLSDSVALLRPVLLRRNIAVEISVASHLESFSMDRNQIQQVIVNIVGNAADAVDGGGVIAIRALRIPENDGLLIAISDNGVGIPEENLEAIFDPFFTTKFSGTGLGLATSRSLVQGHGGDLAVESTLGRGSTFYILLPVRTPSTRAPGPRGS